MELIRTIELLNYISHLTQQSCKQKKAKAKAEAADH